MPPTFFRSFFAGLKRSAKPPGYTFIHPGIAAELKLKVDAAAAADKPRELFCGMFDRGPTVGNVKKGEFAQALAAVIADPAVSFTTPTYIANALAYVTTQ